MRQRVTSITAGETEEKTLEGECYNVALSDASVPYDGFGALKKSVRKKQ